MKITLNEIQNILSKKSIYNLIELETFIFKAEPDCKLKEDGTKYFEC